MVMHYHTFGFMHVVCMALYIGKNNQKRIFFPTGAFRGGNVNDLFHDFSTLLKDKF